MTILTASASHAMRRSPGGSQRPGPIPPGFHGVSRSWRTWVVYLTTSTAFTVKPEAVVERSNTAKGGPVGEGMSAAARDDCYEFKGGKGTASRLLDKKMAARVGVVPEAIAAALALRSLAFHAKRSRRRRFSPRRSAHNNRHRDRCARFCRIN